MVSRIALIIFMVNTFLLFGVDTGKTRKFFCDFCPKVFIIKRFLNRHIHNNHNGQINDKIGCALCKPQPLFDGLMEFDVHHKENHPSFSYFCNVCYDEHKTIGELENHRKGMLPRSDSLADPQYKKEIYDKLIEENMYKKVKLRKIIKFKQDKSFWQNHKKKS